jgi:predicted dehydrogenase
MLHLGIIGCGKVTTMFHLKAIEMVEGIKLVAVADLDGARMENVKRKGQAEKGYTDPKKLLSDPKVEVVAINTPPRFHRDLVIDSLKSKKHILCEKPLAQSIEGCKQIQETQKTTELVVLPVHNYAFTPCLQSACELINRGEIGDTQSIDIKFDNNLWSYGSKTPFRTSENYGIIEDILPHLLSVAQIVADPISKVIEVNAWRKQYKVLDNFELKMITGNKININGEFNWTSVLPGFTVRINGSEGTLYIDLMKAPYGITLKSNKGKRIIGGMKLSQYLQLIQLKHPAFPEQYRHLINVIELRESPKFTIDDEIKMMKVLNNVVQLLNEKETRKKN